MRGGEVDKRVGYSASVQHSSYSWDSDYQDTSVRAVYLAGNLLSVILITLLEVAWGRLLMGNLPLHVLCDDILENRLAANRMQPLANDDSKGGQAVFHSLTQGPLRPINGFGGPETMDVNRIFFVLGI